MSKTARGLKHVERNVLAVMLASAAFVGSWATTARACGVPFSSNIYLYPLDGDEAVATNAKLIGIRWKPSADYWLRKVIDMADAGEAGAKIDPNLDAGMDAGVGPMIPGTEAVLVTVECIPRTSTPVCLGTAPLEPNTRYIWGAIDAADYEPAQSFTTGAGPKPAAPLPDLDVEVTAVRPSVGGGDCAAIKEGTVEVTVSATSEPWIFLSDNSNDLPTRIEGGTTEFKWGTVDPAACFGFQQLNWAGEVVDPGVEVCVPEPLDAGPSDDFLDDSTNPDVTTNNASSSVDATSDAAATSADVTSVPIVAPRPNDAGMSRPDAGNNMLPPEESGCSCRTASGESSSAAGWAGLVLVGLIGRRRRS